MTLAERFIVLFQLPYALGCLFVGFFLFGFVSSYLSSYVETADASAAFIAALTPVAVLIYLLVSYAFFVPHYMRRKLAEAGISLAALHPDREEGYRAAFARVSAWRPQLLSWLLFLAALLLALSVPAIVGTGPSPIVIGPRGNSNALQDVAAFFSLASFAVITLGLSSVVWTYWTVSMGIRRFGESPLRLRSYYEDGFLGLKPLGSLALSLATAYFSFIGLFLATLVASPTVPTIADIVGMGGLLTGLMVLGLLLFFLPLRKLHERMTEQKRRERDALKEPLGAVFHDSVGGGSSQDVGEMLKLDMMERKVSAMALWPFDMRILGRLSVIALSVTAILVSRILALLLRI